MDWADRAVQCQARQAPGRRADPLQGYDLEQEYKYIRAGCSGLHPRIQGLIAARVETGR